MIKLWPHYCDAAKSKNCSRLLLWNLNLIQPKVRQFVINNQNNNKMSPRNQKSALIKEERSLVTLYSLKKRPCKLWPSAWQSRKSLRGRRNSTPFSVRGVKEGAVVIIQSVGVWNPADKHLLSVDLTGRVDWETQKERGDKLSFVRAVGRFCLELDSCSSTSCSHPPPSFFSTTTTTTTLLHMLTGHMLIWLVNTDRRFADGQLMDTESLGFGRHRAVTPPQTVLLISCSLLRACLCVNCRLIWQPLSCTSSIPTQQQHSQIELTLDSEWSERLKGQKEGEAVILCPIRPAQNHLVGR